MFIEKIEDLKRVSDENQKEATQCFQETNEPQNGKEYVQKVKEAA